MSPPVFLALLTIELLLIALTRSKQPRLALAARFGVVIVPLAAALGARTYVALAARDLLQWDETYYLSMAVTAASGHGLYPFVFGYGPMPILGGTGYLAYVYALAVYLAGPTIIGLRVLSLAGAGLALAGMFLLLRSLYGSGAAWIGVALTSALQLFVMSNSARMDTFTFAIVCFGLLAFVSASPLAGAPGRPVRHFITGLIFGLGLQAHIDVTVTAVACGVLYLLAWIRQSRAAGSWRIPTSLVLFVAGWSLGLAIFVVFNILLDPAAFYRTTVQVRVDATTWYSSGSSTVAGSFLNPKVLMAKEVARYRTLWHALPTFEIAASFAAICALAIRRTQADRMMLMLVAGVIVAAAVILNNDSPLYFIHVAPVLMVPLAPLFVTGTAPASTVRPGLSKIPLAGLLAYAVFASALVAVNAARPAATVNANAVQDAADAQWAGRVRALADPRCTIAGDAALYVRYFADYPFFISTRRTEVTYAMMFYDTKDEAEYWRLKSPGVVFSTGALSDGLAAYVNTRPLTQVATGIWMDSDRCRR